MLGVAAPGLPPAPAVPLVPFCDLTPGFASVAVALVGLPSGVNKVGLCWLCPFPCPEVDGGVAVVERSFRVATDCGPKSCLNSLAELLDPLFPVPLFPDALLAPFCADGVAAAVRSPRGAVVCGPNSCLNLIFSVRTSALCFWPPEDALLLPLLLC